MTKDKLKKTAVDANSIIQTSAKRTDWQIYRRLLGYTKPYRGIMAIAFLALAAYAGADVGMAWIMEPLLDEGLASQKEDCDTGDKVAGEGSDIVMYLPFIIIGLFAVRGIAGFVSSYGMTYIGRHVISQMRQEVFEKYLYLNHRYYDTHNTGEMISRILFNIEQVASSVTDALAKVVRESLTIIFLLSLMFYESVMLTCIILVVGPVIVLIVRYITKRFRRLAGNVQGTVAGVSKQTEQTVFGQKIIKMFGAQSYEAERFAAVNEKDRIQRMKEAATTAAANPIIQIVVSFALAVVIYVATSSSMSAGAFAAFMVAAGRLLQPLRAITGMLAALQKGIAAADDVFDVLDTDDERDVDLPNLKLDKAAIDIKNLSFTYDESKGPVLHDVNLSIKSGEMVALVGESGSGKSTIASLLPRLYEWDKGNIYIDGQNIQQINRESLRETIALVSQDIILFDDTIGANIAYTKITATRDQIIEAAKAAHAWDFIQGFPQGLDTVVGERGVMLSGGQRQRLSIARAILKDAPILILDEATAALDTESERKIQAALDVLMQNRTTIVIAHRLSTIESADRIVVMSKGKIIESGTHNDLIAKNSAYANLYNLQFQHH